MSATAIAPLTPDDLLALPDQRNYELVDGELVELPVSMESSWIAGQIFARISQAIRSHEHAWAFPEGTGYACFVDDPNRVRKPDASVVLSSRMPGGPPHRGFGRIAPDLVVEVVSPHDLAEEVNEKLHEWLSAGVRIVCVAYPGTRAIFVHRARGDVQVLNAEDLFTLPDLLPDLCVPVSDLFLPCAGVAHPGAPRSTEPAG